MLTFYQRVAAREPISRHTHQEQTVTAKGVWSNSNGHDWWDDRNGAPPWGWGPPPPIQWNGGPPPPSVNYWGYNLSPVWNDGPRQWGVWLLGQWIPIFGIGFN